MSLPRDLLAQATLLATKEPRRPRQASLRRSVSASHYALFHLLVDTAARRLVSGNDRQGQGQSRQYRHFHESSHKVNLAKMPNF